MTKKVENMTQAEQIEYWSNKRDQARAERQKYIDAMPEDMVLLITDLVKKASAVAETGGYGCNGGVRYLSAFDLQELEDVVNEASTKFNIV